MLVHSPPDRPHLIMLFCFLISRNAKCLCHLWTAKRANLGFSLIATVTSLLRLHWGWVEGMAGGGLEDGRMKTQLSSHTAEVWKNAAGQQNAAWRSPTAGSGGQPALWKSPNTQLRGRRIQLWPVLVSQLWWGDDYIGLDNCWTFFWHLLLPPPDSIPVPTQCTFFFFFLNCSFNRKILVITQQAVFQLVAWHVWSLCVRQGIGGGDDKNKPKWNVGL